MGISFQAGALFPPELITPLIRGIDSPRRKGKRDIKQSYNEAALLYRSSIYIIAHYMAQI